MTGRPPRPGAETLLEERLREAEAEAHTVLREHGPIVKAARATMSPKARRLTVSVKRLFGGFVSIEHDEPKRWTSKVKPLPCTRCEAANWLLVYAGEVRFALANGDHEAAVLFGMAVEHRRVQLGLAELHEAEAETIERHQAQADFARRKRGPFADERKTRDAQIAAWNEEFLTYPSGKRRPRSERVRMIHERCQKVYRDKRAEARFQRSNEGERRAKVWAVGPERVEQLVPRFARKNS